MTEDAENRVSSSRSLVLVALFTGTFLLVLAGALCLKRSPRQPKSEEGLLLHLEVASPGTLSLVYENRTASPVSLVMPRGALAGPEITLVARTASETVPQKGPLESGAGPIVAIPPGGRFLQELALDEFVDLAPGSYEIHVERARLLAAEPRLVSNAVTLRRP